MMIAAAAAMTILMTVTVSVNMDRRLSDRSAAETSEKIRDHYDAERIAVRTATPRTREIGYSCVLEDQAEWPP